MNDDRTIQQIYTAIQAGEMTLEEFEGWTSDQRDDAWQRGIDQGQESFQDNGTYLII